MALNQIALMGRMTREPELRQTQGGKAVAAFSLAVDRDFAPEGGERRADFIDIVVWGKTAEFVARNFTKGQLAAVSGRLQIRDWTDRDGNKRRSAEVVVEQMYFGDSKRDEGSTRAGSCQPPVTEADDELPELGDDDGSLPF